MAENEELHEEMSEEEGTRQKILVVDDEASIRRILETRLKMVGYDVVTAEDGEEAVEVFNKANPDLVGFFASNEGSTVGVARAIEDMGKKDTVMLVGFDKSQDTIRALENGTLKATVVQNPYKMGFDGLQFAVDIIDGKEVTRLLDTGVNVVTLENIDTIK